MGQKPLLGLNMRFPFQLPKVCNYCAGVAQHSPGSRQRTLGHTVATAHPGAHGRDSAPWGLNARVATAHPGTPYSNNRLTDSLKWMRLMASARSGATLSTLMFGNCLLGGSGMLSVTTIWLIGARLRFSIALPHS